MDVKEKAKAKTSSEVSSSGQIRNIQEMWDAAVEFFYNGKSDMYAMKAIYSKMIPSLSYQDIAIVFSGVYADTYWNILFMDASILSVNMQTALLLSKDVADKCACAAIAQWRGVYCRKDASDKGSIPYSGTTYWNSIDVVCNGNIPLEPSELLDDSNWIKSYWKDPVVGKNYVYTRCQNVQFLNEIANPKVQMFYSYAGFNQPPSASTQIKTYNGGNDEGVVYLSSGKTGPMPLGKKGVSEAFSFEPSSSGHVCILSTISTEFFTKNNPKNIPVGNWNSMKYATWNGSSAWHNYSAQLSVVSNLAFYNQDGSPEVFSFVANCRNVPVGSKIGLKSSDPKCSFDSGLIEITSSSQQIEHQVIVPPNYRGDLIVTMSDMQGNMLPANAAVEINMKWILNKGHRMYVQALSHLDAVEKAINSEELSLHMGSYTLTGGNPIISQN